MPVECMKRQRHHGWYGGQQQAYHAQFRSDRGPGNHAGAKAEYQADRDQLQHGLVDREHQYVEQGQLYRRGIIADRIEPFPTPQVLYMTGRRHARIGPDNPQAQEYRQRADGGQRQIYGGVQLHGGEQTHANEDRTEAKDGKPHAV